ncbi:MAG: Ig-like domain-containing protein [Gemmatimonadaceae bacterium]
MMRCTVGRVAVVLLGLACNDGPSVPADRLVSLSISPPRLALRVGQSAQLSLSGVTASGDTLRTLRATWTSASTAAVIVDSTGRVTAVGSGSVRIKAALAEFTASVEATTMGSACSSLTISPASATMRVGESLE